MHPTARTQALRSAGLLVPIVLALVLLASGCVINGTWTATAPAAVTGGDSSFIAVDCVGASWCVGVGAAGTKPLVQTWNGSTWTNRTLPTPGSNPDSTLIDIECLAVDRCFVHGHWAGPPSLLNQFVLTWDGTSWSSVPGPVIPPGGPDTTAFSCVPGTCVFADHDADRTVLWDGSTFASTPTAGSEARGWAIECVSASDCISSGSGGVVSRWDGSTWTEQHLPTFPDDEIEVTDLACPTSTDQCIGVGNRAGAWPLAAAATWDGTTWTIERLPDAPALLLDVSCASFAECMAGSSVDGAFTWNGADWYPAPVPPGTPAPTYADASCTTGWCMAVGSMPATPVRPAAATYTWTNP